MVDPYEQTTGSNTLQSSGPGSRVNTGATLNAVTYFSKYNIQLYNSNLDKIADGDRGSTGKLNIKTDELDDFCKLMNQNNNFTKTYKLEPEIVAGGTSQTVVCNNIIQFNNSNIGVVNMENIAQVNVLW